jgi:signal transduction histidine kinase
MRGSKSSFGAVAEGTPLALAMKSHRTVIERVEIEKLDGARAVLRVSAAPVLDRSGRTMAAVSIFEDITAEEAREKAEHEFVMNAAHELQSPLAAITSAVDVLQSGAKDSAERDLFIDHIDRESRRLDRLIRALLALARAQTELEEPRSELIDICPLLETIAERMEPAEGVSIAVECPLDLALVSNHELLEQAISNVVRNAVKYTEKGTIRLLAAPRGDAVEIVVADTGRGIPLEALPRVVERFYRGDGSADGFGLGLAISQAAIKVLDGKLEVASGGVDRGTTVKMTLPVRAKRVGR